MIQPTQPTYCPLKIMSSKTPNPFAGLANNFTIESKCDQAMCGFWSTDSNMCGIAAIGLLFKEPPSIKNIEKMPFEPEEENEEDV